MVGGFVLVAAGGALGASLRYGLTLALKGAAWPAATFAANAAGSFALGLLAGWAAGRGAAGDAARLMLGMGLLGGFTTFSAFSLELVGYVERRAFGAAAAYGAGSVLVALAAALIGLWLGRRIAP